MNESFDFRLGTLLKETGFVDPEWIKRALTLSQKTGLPIGKCLVLLDCIQHAELLAAVQAQSMLKEGLLDYESFRAAMGIVRRKGWCLEDALTMLGLDAHRVRGSRLGELLISGGLIEASRLSFALRLSECTGLPLGRILISMFELTPSMLETALSIQHMFRSGCLSDLSAAVKLIKRFCHSDRAHSAPVRLGEMLVLSTIVSESQLIAYLVKSRKRGVMLGQLLVEEGAISETLLVAAVHLQDLVWRRIIPLTKAQDILISIHSYELSLDESFSKAGLTFDLPAVGFNLVDFVRATGYLTNDKLIRMSQILMNDTAFDDVYLKSRYGRPKSSVLSQAFKVRIKNNNFFERLLRRINPDQTDLIDAASMLYELVKCGKMRVEQAVIQFNLVRITRETGSRVCSQALLSARLEVPAQ